MSGVSGTENRARRGWLLGGSLVGCLALGGTLMLLPPERPEGPRPASGPAAAHARAAVTGGVPAALGDLAALIDDRQASLRQHPRDARAWAVLGAAYVEQGRRTGDAAAHFPKAEEALRTSLEVRPRGNVAALEGLAALANARHDFRAGRRWARAAASAADDDRWTSYALLVDACSGLGDHAGAGRALERMLELDASPAARARAAGVYRDQGRREDAAAALADAAAGARAPAERAAWLERAGRLAWERGDREGALRYFREAVRVDPDQRAAQAGQGRALAALGRTSEALSVYRIALAKQPLPRYALELGELYESLGLDHAARVQYDLLRERVRNAAAGGVREDLVLGRFEADHGGRQGARAAVRRLRGEWRRRPSPAVADALGWALHRTGAHREALRFAARATDPEHGGGVRPAAYAYHRGMIEKALGRQAPARRHLREALRTNPYFSPLAVPLARKALAELGEVPVDEDVPE
ncbi:tetratricopeptide repeat protein [Streptomyces sp. NPDC006997]|uniref:tetratricopeptide repeat protein n=1 Tax=Streptomyces sp. NPDC006997 TaxID=3155356 RepID=UPI0033F431FF